MSQSHWNKNNIIHTLFTFINLLIKLDKTINKNKNIATKKKISESKFKKSLQRSNNNNITYDINHDYINISKLKEIYKNETTSTIDKHELKGSNYGVAFTSKSIDSNEINPNSNHKGQNNSEIKKTIKKFKDT